MSGSSSAPAAPNYGPITQGLQGLASQEATYGNNQMGWGQNAYTTNLGTTNAAIGSDQNIGTNETAVSNDINNAYLNNYLPLQESYANTAQNYANPQNIKTQMGLAEGTAATTGNQALSNEQQNLESYGIDPSATRYQALNQQGKVQTAANTAAAGNAARENTIQTGLGLESNAINQGLVMPSAAAGAENTTLQANAGAVNAGNSTTMTGANVMGTAPQWLGMENGTYGAYGNTLNQSYQNQLGEFNANQNASSGIGQLAGTFLGLGTGGGNTVGGNLLKAGMAFLAKGGVVPAVGDPDVGAIHNGVVPHHPDGDDNNGPYGKANSKPFVDHHFYVWDRNGNHVGTYPSAAHAVAAQRQAYGKVKRYAGGGAVDASNGSYVPPSMSPSGGAVTDDVPGQTNQGLPIKVNAGEFIMPKDVVAWKGQEFFQKLIDKSREAKGEATAKPTVARVTTRPAVGGP